MDTRHAVLCFLLALVILHANTTSVAADSGRPEVCKYRTPAIPYCKWWTCEAECWVEAKLFLARLQEHRRIEGGLDGMCYCLFCGKHLAMD